MNEATSGIRPHTEISVAPDGSAVTFCSALSHYDMKLHLLRLEPPDAAGGLPKAAGKPEKLTHGGPWHIHNGGWSPDSRTLIYTRDTDYSDILEVTLPAAE